MSVILLLIGFSILVAVGFLIAFIWSVKTGQYDDEYGHSVRILFKDEKPGESTQDSQQKNDTNNQ
ncbi:MAG: cbb3-type cytochrome oxidase assembly protein CcoS [Bacteroidales bacterium]